jgi:Holliday junction resolvasome RuvABC endonuclease subunit
MWIGIDPGLSGAVAIITAKEVTFIDTPTEIVRRNTTRRVYNPVAMATEIMCIKDIKSSLDKVHVAIERQGAMPKQGVSSTFSIGMGYGLWIGIIAAMGLPYTIIEPRAWKHSLMEGMGKEKGASIIRACQLYPKVANDLKLKKNHNRADALLIAEYVRRDRTRK